jgi:hypothetical protein
MARSFGEAWDIVQALQATDPIGNQGGCAREIAKHDVGETGCLTVLGERPFGDHKISGLGRAEIRPAVSDQNANRIGLPFERAAFAMTGL